MNDMRKLIEAVQLNESDDSDAAMNLIYDVLGSNADPEAKLAEIQQIATRWVEADPFLA